MEILTRNRCHGGGVPRGTRKIVWSPDDSTLAAAHTTIPLAKSSWVQEVAKPYLSH